MTEKTQITNSTKRHKKDSKNEKSISKIDKKSLKHKNSDKITKRTHKKHRKRTFSSSSNEKTHKTSKNRSKNHSNDLNHKINHKNHEKDQKHKRSYHKNKEKRHKRSKSRSKFKKHFLSNKNTKKSSEKKKHHRSHSKSKEIDKNDNLLSENNKELKETKEKKENQLNNEIIKVQRIQRIQKWRESQRLKIELKKKKEEEKIRKEIEESEREKLKIIQDKLKENKVKQRKLEAQRLREEFEQEREQKEREEEKYERNLKMIKEKEQNNNNNKEEETIDPLDAFFNNLIVEENTKTNKSQSTQNTINNGKNIIVTKEILSNETLYDEEDLVIKEEVSWLDKMRQKKKEIKKVNHEKMVYNTFRKNFYIESPEITSMTQEQVAIYRRDTLEGVKIRGKNCPRPIKKWSQCGLSDKIHQVIKKYAYRDPFPIQCQAIPCIMSGRDVIACAKTGSGKTLAFVIPMLRHILDQEALAKDEGPIGLILSPTRELALQIYRETRKFALPCGLRVVCCYGGATVSEQIADLRRGTEIIVGTPGRVIDMLCANGGRVTNTFRVTYLVLDEADRMFDMGFEPQIMTIIDNTRPERQTVMFSATFPRQIEGLAKQILINPVEIVIGGRSVASGNVSQIVQVVEESEKFRALLKVLGDNYYKGQILIFVDRQEAVDHLFSKLQSAGYFTLTLHGGMDQTDRDCMIQDFKNKTRTILIATSVAARGLDVQGLNLVINYQVPNHYEDYVHRVGRTGRAGNKGKAVTFITPEQERFAPDLHKALVAAKQKNIPQELIELAENFRKKVESGQENDYSKTVRSSGAKGFKFDETESYQQELQKQRQEAVYGASADKNISQKELKAMQQASALQKAESDSRQKNKKTKKKLSKELSFLEKQLAAAKAGAAAIKVTMNVAASTHCEDDVKALAEVAFQSAYSSTQKSETTNRGKVKAQAIARTLELTQKLGSLGAEATPENLAEAINQRAHTKTFVINDYPQQARWKATNRQSISHISEFSDVAITVRGTHFAPGRKPGPGEEKLALFIEGKSEREVDYAYGELKRMVEETAAESYPDQQSYGKYSVV